MAANDRKIAFIGLGVMGAGMASRLAENGHDITVYNRTRSKADEVGELGAKVADTPADAAKDADVVMISLADQDVVSKVVFDKDGIFETLGEGSYVLDMSTVTPEFARELNGKAREAGYKHMDTCVLGNPMHARQGELRVMCGGEEADFKAVEPLLEAVGKEVTYLGEVGMGATMKLVLNMLMGVQMPALAEAVVFGERAGLDRAKILEMISKSGYSSPVMSFRCAIMGARNFEFAAFKLGLMRKDMTLVLSESQKLGVPMPVSESAYAMLTAAQQQGLGDLDVAAILAFQERMTGMDYPWPGAAEGEAGDDVVIVDVHGHITHPELFKRYPMPPALADIEGMLDRKTAVGIGLTVVGSPVGFGTMMRVPGLDNYAQPLDQLKSFHDWLAETVREYAPRLAAYAYVNPFGGPEMLEQTADTVRDGGFVGLIVNSSVKGEYLDSERADPFFEMAAELGKPIFLHPPAEPVGSDSLEDFRLVEQVGRFVDVTVGLAALVFGGRLEQYPDLQFIAATAGGAISLLAGRLDSAFAPRHYGGGPPKGNGGGGPPGGGGGPPGMRYENKITEAPSTFLANVYVDTANSSVPNHLANLDVMGPDHLLFGTDSPPLATPLEDAIALVDGLPLSSDEKQQVLEGNARRLFGLDGAGAA